MEFVLTNCVSPYCSLSKLQKTVRLSPPLLCICSVFIHYCLIFSCEIFFGLHFFYSLFWWTHRMDLILQPNVNRTSITQCLNSKEKKPFNSSIFFSHSSTLIWHLLLIFLTADLNKLTISTNYSILQLNGLSAGTCKFYTLFFTPYKSKNKQKKKTINIFTTLYCCVWQKRPHLEPIQEESEVEDECETSETEEMEDKEFQSPVGQEDDDEDELTGLQPKRVSRSHNQSFPQVQLNKSQQKETRQLSSSSRNINTPPKRSFNFHKLRWQKHAPPKASARRRTTTRRHQKDPDVSYAHEPTQIFILWLRKSFFLCWSSPPNKEPFPEWLANLMINIEEAKSHPLLVE